MTFARRLSWNSTWRTRQTTGCSQRRTYLRIMHSVSDDERRDIGYRVSSQWLSRHQSEMGTNRVEEGRDVAGRGPYEHIL